MPITSSEKARAWPISRGAMRLDPASGNSPSETKGVDQHGVVGRNDLIAMQEHGGADADRATG